MCDKLLLSCMKDCAAEHERLRSSVALRSCSWHRSSKRCIIELREHVPEVDPVGQGHAMPRLAALVARPVVHFIRTRAIPLHSLDKRVDCSAGVR